MAKSFPVFSNHDAVTCFNCGEALDASAAVDSGYPPKRGAFKKACPKCQMGTWYDVREASK